MKDILGQNIAVGATIAYPGRDRDSGAAYLSVGTVIAITEPKPAEEKYSWRLRDLGSIRVRPIATSVSYRQSLARESVINRTDMVVVVNANPAS